MTGRYDHIVDAHRLSMTAIGERIRAAELAVAEPRVSEPRAAEPRVAEPRVSGPRPLPWNGRILRPVMEDVAAAEFEAQPEPDQRRTNWLT